MFPSDWLLAFCAESPAGTPSAATSAATMSTFFITRLLERKSCLTFNYTGPRAAGLRASTTPPSWLCVVSPRFSHRFLSARRDSALLEPHATAVDRDAFGDAERALQHLVAAVSAEPSAGRNDAMTRHIGAAA